MPYDYEPGRGNYRQGGASRSGSSSRYGGAARGRDYRGRDGQRGRSSAGYGYGSGSARGGGYGSGAGRYGSGHNGGDRGGSHRGHTGYGNSSRTQGYGQRNQRPPERDAEARRRSRNLTMPDTGYSLHSRRVRGSNGSLSHRLGMFDGRIVVLAAILILVVVVLISGITSCVRGANSSDSENTKQMSAADSRVAAGVSDSMVSEFSSELDRNEKLAQIAANADQYDDDRLLQLALDEPAAISFVAGYPTAEKTTSGYNQSVSIGNPPLLYDWNTAWGYATYGDGCIAVTGSEPTTLSMAYMGLTGNTDQTPVGAAKALNSASTSSSNTSSDNNDNSSDNSNGSDSSSNSDSSDSTGSSGNADSSNGSSTGTTSTGSSDADAFCAAAKNLGLTPTVLNVASSSTASGSSSDSSSTSSSSASTSSSATTGAQTLTASLQKGALVAVKLKSQTLTDNEHWALVVSSNSDGSVSVYDPTSSSVSSHTWGAGTVANSATEMISLVAAKSDSNNAQEGASASSNSESTGNSTSSSSSSNGNSATAQGQGQNGSSTSSNSGNTGSGNSNGGAAGSGASGSNSSSASTGTGSTKSTNGTSGSSSSKGSSTGSSKNG